MMQKVDYGQEVSNVLDVLADRFGTTAEFLWGTLVSYHYTMGFMGTALAGFLFVVGGVFFYTSWASNKKLNAGGIDKEERKACKDDTFGFFVCGSVIIFIGVILMFNYLPDLLIPEYGALREVLRTLR